MRTRTSDKYHEMLPKIDAFPKISISTNIIMYYNLIRFDGRGYSPAGCAYKYNMSIYVNTTAAAVRTVLHFIIQCII